MTCMQMDFKNPALGEARLERGRATMYQALRRLIRGNKLTNKGFSELAQWSNPWAPKGWVSNTMVSYIIHEKTSMLGPGAMDALGQLNLQLARYAGASSTEVDELPDLGKPPSRLRLPPADEVWFIRSAETGLPCDAGDLYRIRLGRLQPEGADPGTINDEEAKELSTMLSMLGQTWCRQRKLLLSEGMPQILELYPVAEQERKRLLQLVIAGLEIYQGQQLMAELPAIGELVGGLTGKPAPVTSTALGLMLRKV